MEIPNGKKHLVWVRIAKTGSMSTERTLSKLGVFLTLSRVLKNRKCYKPGKHILCVDDLNKLDDVGVNIDDCYVFTVVRNPYERALSGWRGHTWFKWKNKYDFLKVLKNPPQRPDKFYRDLRDKKEKMLESAWRHFTKTMTQTCSVNDELRIDTVIKLENYNEELTAFLNKIGFKKSCLSFRKQKQKSSGLRIERR